MTGQVGAATGTRHKVIGFAVTLAVLSYIDRVCISQAAPIISKEFHLDKGDMGSVFAAFALAYALFEIPGGWMGDLLGPRKVLMRIVIWWSFFTAITGFMWDKTSLIVARFLFGAGEAGCCGAVGARPQLLHPSKCIAKGNVECPWIVCPAEGGAMFVVDVPVNLKRVFAHVGFGVSGSNPV